MNLGRKGAMFLAIDRENEWRTHVNKTFHRGSNDMAQLLASKAEIYSGVKELVTLTGVECIHLGRMSKQLRTMVLKGLRSGVLASSYGKSGFVYRMLCKQYNIPACFCNDGKIQLSDVYTMSVRNEIEAKHKLSADDPKRAGTNRNLNYMYGSKLKPEHVAPVIEDEYSRYRDKVELAVQAIKSNGIITTKFSEGE